MSDHIKMSIFCLLYFVAIFSPIHATYVWNTKYVVNASSTDPMITDDPQSGQSGFGPHTIYLNTSNPSLSYQPLFVFLPATLVQSSQYEYILNMAASLGWKAVGLAYHNTADATDSNICGSAGLFQQDCQIDYRMNTLVGGGSTSAQDSIANRLYKLLIYLHSQYPNQGWDQFYTSPSGTASTAANYLLWDRMAWGGHSQGGGTVQLVAMCYPTRRVLQIAPSGIITTHPAVNYTSLDSYYTFCHVRDSTEYIVEGIITLGPLDLLSFGPNVTVDSVQSYGTSHVLFTNSTATVCASVGCHACVALDTNLQKDSSGHPVFEPVWEYMLGGPVYLTAPSSSSSPGSSVTPSPGSSSSPGVNASSSPSSGSGSDSTDSHAGVVSPMTGLWCTLLAFMYIK